MSTKWSRIKFLVVWNYRATKGTVIITQKVWGGNKFCTAHDYCEHAQHRTYSSHNNPVMKQKKNKQHKLVIRLRTGSYALQQEQSWWAKLQDTSLILILASSLCLPTYALFTNGFTPANNNEGLLMRTCLTRNLYILNAATLLAIWFSRRQLAWQQEL